MILWCSRGVRGPKEALTLNVSFRGAAAPVALGDPDAQFFSEPENRKQRLYVASS